MISFGRLAPGDQWDQCLLDDLFDNKLYPTGLEFRRVLGYPQADGCILLVPGRYWAAHTDQINNVIKRYAWLLLVRTSDEEDLFDISKIKHPNVRFWVQTPRTDRDYGDARLIPLGYTPHFRGLPAEQPVKNRGVFLAGQKTHERRWAAFGELHRTKIDKRLVWSHGFTEGIPQHEYVDCMLGCKVAPAPAGPASPDTFRLYEALEANCVPVADDVTPAYDSAGYWRKLFPDCPFPILTDEKNWPGYCQDGINAWPANANRIAAWWMRQKREMTYWLRGDLQALGAL